MIRHEKEICLYLNLPSIPKKRWDGKSGFKNGVGILNLQYGEQAYAVCRYDEEVDEEPQVIKVFANEPYTTLDKVFVVPNYMDLDVESADLDEESKKAAERLAEEARELAKEDEGMKVVVPENPWVFDEIHDMEEAQAFIRNYNSRNRIKGKIPNKEETIKLRLLAIYQEQANCNK